MKFEELWNYHPDFTSCEERKERCRNRYKIFELITEEKSFLIAYTYRRDDVSGKKFEMMIY